MSQAITTPGGSVPTPQPSQFTTDRTHPGRWTITFNNPPINMFVPATVESSHSKPPELWSVKRELRAVLGMRTPV
jgi:hypothetical protein